MKPKISIILPCYNVEKYIEIAVESIKSQTFQDFEAIFVNDGSTDDTQIVFQNLQLDSRFKMYEKHNEGSGYARNYGLSRSVGEYVYFMDPDDEIKPTLLEIALNNIECSNLDAVMFGYIRLNETNHQKRTFLPMKHVEYQSQTAIIQNFEEIFKASSIFSVWNKLYKKSFLIDNDLWFTSLPIGQDAVFNIEVFSNLNSFGIIPETLYIYKYSRDGSARTEYNQYKYNSEITIYKKLLELFKKWDMLETYAWISNLHLINAVYEEFSNQVKSQDQQQKIATLPYYQAVVNLKFRQTVGLNMKVKLALIKLYNLLGS